MANYLSKTGSVVTSPWTINTMSAGKIEADSVPSNTEVKVHVKANSEATPVTLNDDFREFLDDDPAVIKQKIRFVEANLDSLDTTSDDMLLKTSVGKWASCITRNYYFMT